MSESPVRMAVDLRRFPWIRRFAADYVHAFPNVAAVPVFDLFQGRPDRLASDRFHPNRDGYRTIADRVIQTLPRDL